MPKHTAISHTIATPLVRRLERIAYRHRVSRSAIVEYAVVLLFKSYPADIALAEALLTYGRAGGERFARPAATLRRS